MKIAIGIAIFGWLVTLGLYWRETRVTKQLASLISVCYYTIQLSTAALEHARGKLKEQGLDVEDAVQPDSDISLSNKT